MIKINASEKKAILEKYPNIYIVRTMKGDSKRHHYYMEESRPAMNMLRKLREQGEYFGPEKKGGGKNRTDKKT